MRFASTSEVKAHVDEQLKFAKNRPAAIIQPSAEQPVASNNVSEAIVKMAELMTMLSQNGIGQSAAPKPAAEPQHHVSESFLPQQNDLLPGHVEKEVVDVVTGDGAAVTLDSNTFDPLDGMGFDELKVFAEANSIKIGNRKQEAALRMHIKTELSKR